MVDQVIKLKRNTANTNAPDTGDIVVGELAIGAVAGKLYMRKSDDSILTFSDDSNVSTTLTIAADSGSNDTVTVGTNTLTFNGTSNQIGTTVSDNAITIALADNPVIEGTGSIRVPDGTTGQQLDSLARQFLWSEGKDFDHGTGHGVGHYLSVHEGPQRISKTSTIPLKVGMVLSNEPGFYKTGCFGIRIENLMTVKLIKSAKETKQKRLFGFDILSFVPYDVRLIDKNILSQKEINWINDYHSEVKKRISPNLDSKTKDFLISITPDI